MKNQPELLIDWVYRSTFKKELQAGDTREHQFEIRKLLRNARRCVLDDAMAAFLYTLMVETYTTRTLRQCYARLDDCRHFARLPHRATWVEYDLNAMHQRERETKSGWIYCASESEIMQTQILRPRIGWLLHQHEKEETAVCADYFIGGLLHNNGQAFGGQSGMAMVWCTDDAPLPWNDAITLADMEQYKHDTKLTPSSFASGIIGYNRDNVGLRRRLGVRELAETSQGRARMMWCFLSAFNKVPVIGERRVVPSHGFIGQGQYHRFLEHSVLTINVPEKIGLRKVARNALALIRRRAHQVRGHWRDDWRKPKGNKALWVDEHQRGDASLGFVIHDYAVKHDES